MSSPHSRAQSLYLGALIGIGLVFTTYGVIYYFPTVSIWKDILLYLITIIAALWSASTATMLWKAYQADPNLRQVWQNFALALWLWTIAETLWTYQAFSSTSIDFGVADIFWLIAYLFFGIALYAQYKLILTPPKWQGRAVLAAILVLTLALSISFASFLAHQQQETITFYTFISAFYPAADLAVGLGALWIVYSMRGGMFGRPWIAMFFFVVADALYAWLFNLGQYQALIEQSTWPQHLTESLYLFAYLFIGLGCFTQWLTLRYGFFFHAKKS